MLVSLQNHLHRQRRLSDKHHGTVVNNEDPERIGCVQIRIPGVVDGPDEALPWAYPSLPVGGGSAGNQGFRVPNKNATVLVEFPDDDPYTPYYTGWLPSKATRNEALAPEDKYPTVYGSTDEQGTGIRVDRTDEEVTARTSSGASLKIDAGGNGALLLPGNLLVSIGGDFRVVADGRLVLDALGDIDISTLKDLLLLAGFDLSTLAHGSTSIESIGSNSLTAGLDNVLSATKSNKITAVLDNTLKATRNTLQSVAANVLQSAGMNSLRAARNTMQAAAANTIRAARNTLTGAFSSRGASFRHNGRNVGSTHKHIADGKPTTPPVS